MGAVVVYIEDRTFAERSGELEDDNVGGRERELLPCICVESCLN